MTDLSAIERIRKLLKMTVANGCTEAEAMAAARKVAALMAELDLQAADIEMEAERVRNRRGTGSVRANLWAMIAACSNTAAIADGHVIEFIGRAPGPEIASYLHLVTDRAIDRELKLFRRGTWYKRRRTLKAKRAASDDFTTALVQRLSVRLWDIFGPTVSDELNKLAQAELARRYSKHRPAETLREGAGIYREARWAGRNAAEGVQLAHGVNAGAGGGTKLLAGH